MKRYITCTLLALGMLSQGVIADETVQLVIIKDFKFSPQEVTIKRGTSVRWENREKRQYHSVWFEASGDPESDYLFPEDVYERKFDASGSFPYHCGPHPEMTGTVHVTEP